MTTFQKVVKYLAIAFAAFLTVSIIGGLLSAIGLFGGFIFRDTATGDMEAYTVSSEIRNIDIDISAADLCIEEGDKFYVESNLKRLKVEEKSGRLTIKETNKQFSKYYGAMLTIYVPADTVFDRAILNTGAGRLTIDSLSADVLRFELGAGEVSIDSLTASKTADIDGGAGRITISDGSLNDLNLNVGVGQLNLTSELTGNCDMELGVGESNINIIGNKEDYRLVVEKGIGNVTVDGNEVSDYQSGGNGSNSIKIDGGVGTINVRFEESDTK
ncbi:MAG: DUF4097 domain-containing protein [Clostridiales bacterium]|nr:DUF4097 domain-containing protein [Clostridiales bacterium]